MGHLPGIFLGVVFILAGFLLARRATITIREIGAAQSWPRVSCTIVRCEVAEQYRGGSDGAGGMQYHAEIEYTYDVDSKSYSNDEISMGGDGSTSNREAIEALCNKYPVDSKQEIFYDPDDPEEAYLELTTKIPKIEIMGGVVFILAGIAILWMFGSIPLQAMQ